MAFWSNWFAPRPNHAGTNTAGYHPGDPDGVVVVETPTEFEGRSFPGVFPGPWSGWPSEWSTPMFNSGNTPLSGLVDTAWMCLDLNASVLSTMPVYRTRNGQMIDPTTWMANPDPTVYTSWTEFAKQLFWDYQLGEAFVLPMAYGSDGFPLNFRVIPPWLVNVDLRDGGRSYFVGSMDVTNEILHIRYQSTTATAHGVGPLEAAGARMITSMVLAKYVTEVASTGGVPIYTLETDMDIDRADAEDLQSQWLARRQSNLGAPPVLDNSLKLVSHQGMSPKDMMMLEVAQFNDSRIAELLGVPAQIVGLPVGDPQTYKNITSLFDYHDRAGLRPKATQVMSALSYWALPRGQCVELNRDEYTRPEFDLRAAAWVALVGAGIVTVNEVRAAERLPELDEPADSGVTDGQPADPGAMDGQQAAVALTGGGQS